MSKYQKIYQSLFPFIMALFAIFLSTTADACPHTRNMRPQNVAYCKTTECILSFGFRPIYKSNYGDKYVVGYANPQSQSGAGHAARQVGHGVMCLATLGLWEIAMDPIEKSAGNIIVRATYANQHTHFIEKIEIHGNY